MAEVHEVAPGGDVKLICLNDGNEEGTFIVSSVVLCMGSPVFEAMLGPHFKEGKTLAGSARLELPLPEDEPWSMLTMCQVMHMKAVTAAPGTSKQLLGLAVLADKYDCKIALSYPISSWMQRPDLRDSDQDRINLFTAAYLLGLEHDFAILGRDIVLRNCSQTSNNSLITNERLQNAIDTLNKQRTKLVRGTAQLLERTMQSECSGRVFAKRGSTPAACAIGCTYQANRARDFMTMLLSTSLWPPTSILDKSIKSLSVALQNEPASWCKETGFCSNACKGRRMQTASDVLSSIKYYGREMQRRIIIPCLQCVRDGERLPKGRCRKRHGEKLDVDSESDTPSYESGFYDDDDDDDRL